MNNPLNYQLTAEAKTNLNHASMRNEVFCFKLREGKIVMSSINAQDEAHTPLMVMPAENFFVHPLPSAEYLARCLSDNFVVHRNPTVALAGSFIEQFNNFSARNGEATSLAETCPQSKTVSCALAEFRRKHAEVKQYVSDVHAWMRELRFFCHGDKEALGYADFGRMPAEGDALTYAYSFPLAVILDEKFLAALQKGTKMGVSVSLQRQVILDVMSLTLRFEG